MAAHTVLSLERLAQMAALLGKRADAARFAKEGKALREVVAKEFLDPAHGTWFSVKRRDGAKEYPDGHLHTTQLATVLARDYVPLTDPVAVASFEASYGDTVRNPFVITTQLRLPELLFRRNTGDDVDAGLDLTYNDLDAGFNEFGRSYLADCVNWKGEICGPAPRPDLQPLPQGWSHTFYLLSLLELAGVGYDAERDAVVVRPVLPKARTTSGHRKRPDETLRIPRYPVDWSYIGVRNAPVPGGALVHAFYRDSLATGEVVVDLTNHAGGDVTLVLKNTSPVAQQVTVRAIGGTSPGTLRVTPGGESVVKVCPSAR